LADNHCRHVESAPAVRAQRRRQDLERLEPELGGDLALTHGDTDSERLSRSSRATPSATAATRARASSRPARWVAAELPMFAISLILAGPEDLLASRALVEVVPRRSGQR
jgi:hypothetical protein